MRYQKEFDQIDRLCEEVNRKVKDLKEVLSVQAFINEEKNENNDFTQLGIKLSNLCALSKQQAKINKFCQELNIEVDNIMSNFKGSVTEPEETLLEQKAQLLISPLFELAPTNDMIILTMRRLRDEIVSLFLPKGQCDPAVTHYLEKGDQGQNDTLRSILKWLNPNGYDIISQPLTKTTYSQNTEEGPSSAMCDSVTVTDNTKNDNTKRVLYGQNKQSISKSKRNKKSGYGQKFPRMHKKEFKINLGGSGRTQKSKRARIKRTKLFKICHFLRNIYESPCFLPFLRRFLRRAKVKIK